MEHLVQQVSEVCSLMPCQLDWCQLKPNGWAFWSIKHDDELQYQQTISAAADPVVSTSAMVKLRVKSLMAKMSIPHISLVQFWSPIQINGSTFLSTVDQLFVFNKEIDKRLSSYRRLCLDTLIPIDYYKEALVAPPVRVFRRWLPEYNPDVQSYSAAEFPLLQTAIRLGLHSYYAFPLLKLPDQRCLDVFEVVCTQPSLCLPNLIKNNGIQRIEKDHGITHEILEQHFGMTLQDAAKDLRGDIIMFQLSISSTRVELEGEVEKRLKKSVERFSIKCQDEDDDWILITTDSDLRDGMHSLGSLGRTTMRLLVTPEADT
ncbi:hypothetical protein H5410_057644 [Solanum commersonii]|uniref:PB1 domain-containing protein n=1 Tax=Solanum commersonii TaxID=4109 RepID=A0A9J5WRE5_SOLCO|nr:hypothetical protein H5410_057644 [Solanum commersonii]